MSALVVVSPPRSPRSPARLGRLGQRGDRGVFGVCGVFGIFNLLLAGVACGDDLGGGITASESGGEATVTGEATGDTGEPMGETSAGEGTTGTTSAGETSDSHDTRGETTTGGDMTPGGGLGDPLCGRPPPPGAELPLPLPTHATCPIIETGFFEGEATNVVTSSGAARSFAVIAPEDLAADELLPVIFMWHWLGGSAKSFYERSAVQEAANLHRFLAVIPESKGDVLFRWPFSALDSDARMEEEFRFFDDMLACVAEQFLVDASCVSSTGVSAGALFTGQLAQGRSERLAAMMPLSGGVGGSVKPWKGAAHRMPALVLWGGPDDFCVAVDFHAASLALQEGLESGGHFNVECIHNCGHSTPPFEVPEGYADFAPLWLFAMDHPYWLEDGESPYAAGLPEGFPEWCAVGAGNAEIRDGECSGSEC